jgi:hypothetical protein
MFSEKKKKKKKKKKEKGSWKFGRRCDPKLQKEGNLRSG